jgi:hypothetical protein
MRKISMINMLLALALLASVVAIPTRQAAATVAQPNMQVTLIANDTSYYSATVYAGKQLILRAKVKNVGNVPLQVTANLTVPAGWGVTQNKFSDCPDSLGVRKSCTISWYFNPQTAGQVYLWVYVRAFPVPTTAARRITQTPLFIFNVKPAKK